jgi:hypothetical protein
MLATGPKVHKFKPGQGDGCFKGDKNAQHAFLWRGSKARDPMLSDIKACKNHLGSMNKNTLQGRIHHFLCPFLLLATR